VRKEFILANKSNEEIGMEKMPQEVKPETASMDISKSPVADEATKLESGSAVKPAGWALVWPKDIKSAAIKSVVTLLVLFLATTLGFGVAIYVYKSESPIVKAYSQVVPYPVEIVNNNWFNYATYYNYLFEVDANKRAYQNNAKLNNQQAVDFGTKDGQKLVVDIKKHALDKLKSDLVTAQLASQKKITVTDKDVDKMINDLYTRYGGKQTLLKTINQIYAWNLDDLRGVVRKQLLSQKLQDAVTGDKTMLAQAKAKADDVLKQIKAGGDFAELAKKYSQASDASSGGDLGSFTKSQLPTDIQKTVDALQVGQISDPVKTQYGYEIIKLISRDGDNLKASHILIKTTDFTEYFNAELKKAKTLVWIKV
jgi:parvulin-like peptidyl-prolyl isomerase